MRYKHLIFKRKKLTLSKPKSAFYKNRHREIRRQEPLHRYPFGGREWTETL
jgi:hypothetical protein